MSGLYNPEEPTDEQIVLEAVDAHKDALKDEIQLLGAAIIFYFVGIIMILLTDENTQPARIGSGLLWCGLLCFFLNIILGFRTRKKRRLAKELVDPYLRKRALPFYQELIEMFADKPGVHLHLNDNGTITVTDKRNQDKEIK